MEKFHLSMLNQEVSNAAPDSETTQRPENDLEIREKIANAFLRQRYPLSPEGEKLKAELEDILQSGNVEKLQEFKDKLPTIEHPHLELFENFELSEQQKEEIFFGLADIQVTKGCRHKCTFCAAGAADKVGTMPFAAVLKIAEQKQEADKKLLSLWEGWGDYLREKDITPEHYSPLVDQLFERMQQVADLTDEERDYLQNRKKLWEEIKTDQPKLRGLGHSIPDFLSAMGVTLWLSNLLPHLNEFSKEFYGLFEQMIQDVKRVVAQHPFGYYFPIMNEYNDIKGYSHYGIPFDGVASAEADENAKKRGVHVYGGQDYRVFLGTSITNYYDSDVFDYKDASFLHEDGTPAHYGDVFEVIASEIRPIHITTAGFPRRDTSAQRAAEKLQRLYTENPKKFSTFRISVNPYEATARRDLDRYKEDIFNTLESLKGIKIEILFFKDVDNSERQVEFLDKVFKPLKEFIKEKKLNVYITNAGISSYSGPRRTDEINPDDHHDVMACLAGIHIWPDGQVTKQATFQNSEGEKNDNLSNVTVPKGSRPTPIDIQLFELSERKSGADLISKLKPIEQKKDKAA